MAGPKPLPFSRVRVLENAESGAYRRFDERRLPQGHRPGPLIPWRQQPRPQPEAALPAPPTAVDAEEPEAGEPKAGLAAAGTAAAHRRVDDAPAIADASTDDAGPDEPAHEPPEAAPRGPRRRPGAWLAEPQATAPIAAIARAVEESAALQSVADLVARTCEGDGKRETGPWELTLPLQAHGLGRSRLTLRLSRELLKLRFDCDGRSLRDLLWRHSRSLQSRLEERLQLPLELELELCDG
jgi:hypothetical protein